MQYESLVAEFGSQEAVVEALRKQGAPQQLIDQLGSNFCEFPRELCSLKIMRVFKHEDCFAAQMSVGFPTLGHKIVPLGTETAEKPEWVNFYARFSSRIEFEYLTDIEYAALEAAAEWFAENPKIEDRPLGPSLWYEGEGFVRFLLCKAGEKSSLPLAIKSVYWEGMSLRGSGIRQGPKVEEWGSLASLEKTPPVKLNLGVWGSAPAAQRPRAAAAEAVI